MQKWIITGSLVLILASPGIVVAQDTRSVLWTATAFRASDYQPWWKIGRVFPSEAECRAEGRAQARTIAAKFDNPESQRLGQDTRLIDDGMTVQGIQKAGNYKIGTINVPLSASESPLFSASCWPVGVNPQ